MPCGEERRGSYHYGLATPPLLRSGKHHMSYIDGSLRHQRNENSKGKQLEAYFRISGKLLRRFYHSHCASRPLGERTASRTRLWSTVISICRSGSYDRAGHEGRRKHNKEEDWITNSKGFQKTPHDGMATHDGQASS